MKYQSLYESDLLFSSDENFTLTMLYQNFNDIKILNFANRLSLKHGVLCTFISILQVRFSGAIQVQDPDH